MLPRVSRRRRKQGQGGRRPSGMPFFPVTNPVVFSPVRNWRVVRKGMEAFICVCATGAAVQQALTLHSVHGVSQQHQLTCLQQACCSLQQLERDYASRPHGYNARHHDAHALHSSQRAWLNTAQRSWRGTTAAVDLFTASMLFTAARTRPCIATTRLQCATS